MNPIKITISPEMRAFNREVQAADRMLEYKFDQEPVDVLVQQLNIAEMPAHANCLIIATAKLHINSMEPIKAMLDIAIDNRHTRHMEHAKKLKLSKPCSDHDMNFGGECFNCGYKP